MQNLGGKRSVLWAIGKWSIAYIFKGGKGGLRNEFINNNFAFFTRQETNSTFDLCDVFGRSLCGY